MATEKTSIITSIKFLKRFNADGSYASNATKEEDALEDLKKRVQKQVEYKKWLLGEKDEL